jgi:hypothetical protein
MRELLLAAVIIVLRVATASPAEAASNVLQWMDTSTNETAFHVERRVIGVPITGSGQQTCAFNPGPYTLLATLPADTVTYTDTAVVEGQSYCYRVSASNAGGASAFSNEAGRTVPLVPPVTPVPSAPGDLQVVAGP